MLEPYIGNYFQAIKKKNVYIDLSEGEREKKRSVRETSVSCLLDAPYWWLSRQPGHVPLPGIEPKILVRATTLNQLSDTSQGPILFFANMLPNHFDHRDLTMCLWVCACVCQPQGGAFVVPLTFQSSWPPAPCHGSPASSLSASPQVPLPGQLHSPTSISALPPGSQTVLLSINLFCCCC